MSRSGDDLTAWKGRVAARFGAAAGGYDASAPTQQATAQALAGAVLQRARWTAPQVAEVGCGTGFLTAALLPSLAPARWLATDLAAPMLAATEARLGGCSSLETQVMDGEQPTLQAGGWDLVCSNLAVQWFVDLGAGLRRLYQTLAPGGLLAVTTLGRQSLAPWAAACEAEGIAPFSHRYPSPQELSALCPGAEVSSQFWPLGLPEGQSAAACLAALRAIGADTPPPGQGRASPAALRGAVRRLAGQGLGGYQVLTLLWAKADCSADANADAEKV